MVEKPPRNDENKENGCSVAAFFAQVQNLTGSPPSPELPTALRPQMDPLQNLFEDPAVVSVLPLEITISYLTNLKLENAKNVPKNAKNIPRKYHPTNTAQSHAQNSEKYLIIFNKNVKNIPKNAKIIPKKYHPTYIAQSVAQNSEKYRIKSNKIAQNIPKNAKNIPKKYHPTNIALPLTQNSEKYLGRPNSGSIRLMGQSKCRPKNQNHPYTRPLTPKDPMEPPREHGVLSKVYNGDRLSDALMKMTIEKEFIAYQNKYVELEIHNLWFSQNNQIEQATIPLGSQCHQHPTNSLVFCSQCTTENPKDVQPEAAQSGGSVPPKSANAEAAEAFVSEATETTATNEAATHAAAQGAVDATAPPGGFQDGDVQHGGGSPPASVIAEAAEAFVSEAIETTNQVTAQATTDEAVDEAADEAPTQAVAQGADDAVALPGGFQDGDVQPGIGRGVNSVEEQSAPFGSMEYMPEAWRNFKINLDDFLPASPDPEMVKLLLNFVL